MRLIKFISLVHVNLFCEAVWRARVRNLWLHLTLVCLKIKLAYLILKKLLTP